MMKMFNGQITFFPILLTYNNKNIHNTTQFTPSDAIKNINHLAVKLNMEMKAKRNRKYPDVNVGDNVKMFRKKKKRIEINSR